MAGEVCHAGGDTADGQSARAAALQRGAPPHGGALAVAGPGHQGGRAGPADHLRRRRRGDRRLREPDGPRRQHAVARAVLREARRQAASAERHRVGLRAEVPSVPLLPGAPAAVDAGAGRRHHGPVADGQRAGRRGRADPVLRVPAEVAGGDGGVVGGCEGGQQRHAGLDRRAGCRRTTC